MCFTYDWRRQMRLLKRTAARISIALLCAVLVAGCSPKVGSDAWCADMKKKPAGDWTANEASDFAKHCVFK